MKSAVPEVNKLVNQEDKHCESQTGQEQDQTRNENDPRTVDSQESYLFAKVWHSLYISMMIFGLVWKTMRANLQTARCRCEIKTIHSCIVLILVWFNALKYFLEYDGSDSYGPRLFKKIWAHIFTLQMACGITSSVYLRCKKMPEFFSMWYNYKLKYEGVPTALMTRIVVIRVLVINLLLGSISIIWFSCIIIRSPEIYQNQEITMFAFVKKETPIWLVALGYCLNIYQRLAWLQSVIFCICMTKNLREEFHHFTVELINVVDAYKLKPCGEIENLETTHHSSTPNNASNNQLETYRQRYVDLCRLVSSFDDVISLYLLFTYLFSIPIIVILIYALWSFDTKNIFSFILSVGSLLVFLAIMVTVTASSASLNTSVSIYFEMKYILLKWRRLGWICLLHKT